MTTFITKDALPLFDKSLDTDHAPPNEMEEYYSPTQDEKIVCTTDEREDFEQDMEIALTADVIADRDDYDCFVRYLAENCKLERMS